MNRTLELKLMDELITLKRANSPFFKDTTASGSVDHYSDPAHFELERARVLRRRLNPAADLGGPWFCLGRPTGQRRVRFRGLLCARCPGA